MALSPETIREIEKLAAEMGQAFSPPEFIPGCEVLSVADKDQYTTDNGWIEAICGQHNNQRCRWKAKFAAVTVGDYVDVLYFKSVQLFEVFAKSGTGDVNGLPVTTKGDLLGFSTLADRYPKSGNDGWVLTEDSTADFGFAWAEPVAIATYYLHTESADISGYEQARLDPADDPEVEEITAVRASTSPALIDPYVSYPTTGVGKLLIDAGVWTFNIWGKVDSGVGTSTISCNVYKRDTGGSETLLFSVETPELTTSAALYSITSVQSDIPLVLTDRIVFKFYANTTSVPSRDVYFYYEGTARYTHIDTPLQVPIASGGGWPYTNVLTVDPSDADADYTTITLAIAGATAGDAIWIGNATYTENVTVNKKLYLIGASREGVIIDGTFTTTTADCVIENLTIFRDDAGASDVNIFTAGADATLRRVTLSGLTVTTTGALNGVYNVNTYEVTTEDCVIKLADTSSATTHGIYVDAASATVNIVGGKIDAQSSGGAAYDVRINEDGGINLRDPELANNTLDEGSGTISGQYTTDGVLHSLDDIIQSNGNGIYPGGDGAALLERWQGHNNDITDHFNAFSGWSWAAYSPYDGAPSIVNTSDYLSILRLTNDDITEDHFSYKALTATDVDIKCRLSKGAYSYVGIRVDDNSDNNFVELRLVDSAAYAGQFRCEHRYQTGGGGVTSAFYFDPLPPGFFVLRLAYLDSSNFSFIYLSKDSPIENFVGGSTPTWSATNYGFTFGQRFSASNSGLSGIFDWIKVEET